MAEESKTEKREPFDLTVYTFALEKCGSKEKAREVLRYVKEHKAAFQYRYPPKGENYQLQLCAFTNEVCKQVLKSDEDWMWELTNKVGDNWPDVNVLFSTEPQFSPKPQPEPEPVIETPAPRRTRSASAPEKTARAPEKRSAETRHTERTRRARGAAADPEPAPEPRPEGMTLLEVLAVLLMGAAMLWMLAGLLMALNVIPNYDLGYTWFNQHVLPLF